MTTTETRSAGRYMRWLRQPRSAPPWPVTGRPSSVAAAEAEAVARRACRRRSCTGAERRCVQRVGVVAGRVDVAFPGDHVVEAGAEAGIAGPQDAVLGGAKAGCRACPRSPRCRRAWRGCRRRAVRVAMPARSKMRVRSSSAKPRPVRVLQDVGENAEILVDVGVAGAGRELQRARAGDDAGGFDVAERCLGGRAVQHRHAPSSRAGRTGCGTGAARSAAVVRRCGRRARTSSSSTDGSGKASSSAAQVNCLVMEHMRNSVRGVKGMRRSALAQPQAWRTSTSPSRSTATAPPGPG